MGVAVYYSLPPYNEWQYVGPISVSNPTRTFRAQWMDKIPLDLPALQIGIALDSLEVLKAKVGSDAMEDERALNSAKGIASHLFNFMSSYSQSPDQYQRSSNKDVMIVPCDCIDKWLKKFLDKHRRDPYFWMSKK